MKWLVFALLLAVALTVIGAAANGGIDDNSGRSGGRAEPTSQSTRLVNECRSAERLIKQNLNDPGSVDWSGNCWLAGSGRSGYTKIDNTWYIRFRARNAFGGMTLNTCRVEVIGDSLLLRGC